MTSTPFRAFRIHNDTTGYRAGLEPMSADDLSPGELLVKVAYSSVNYKDALAGTGKGKILRRFPLNGGIDVAGYVAASADPAFKEGDQVLCTGCGLSETRDGGFAEYVRLESKWTIPLPAGLTLRESMALGTAGFTAALALFQMMRNGQTPEMGPIVVTGATGGVGSLAIDILTRAGFEAHAITGKVDHFDYLQSLGAQQCIARSGLYWGQRPLENAHWAGAIDNVGGDLLAGLSRVIKPYGNHRDLRQRGRHRARHDGDAVHHPRRQPARHRVGRHRARYPRAHLGAPRRRLEAGASGPDRAEGRRARRSSRRVRKDARRRLARPHGGACRLIGAERTCGPSPPRQAMFRMTLQSSGVRRPHGAHTDRR